MSKKMHVALCSWTIFYSVCFAIGLFMAVDNQLIGVFVLIASLFLEWLLIWYVSWQLKGREKIDAVAYGLAMLFSGGALAVIVVVRKIMPV